MAKKSKKFDPVAFDKAAENALKELKTLDSKAVKTVALWWKANFMKAGHKRLARGLLGTLPKPVKVVKVTKK